MWCPSFDHESKCEMTFVLLFEVDEEVWDAGRLCIPCVQGRTHMWHDDGTLASSVFPS
jgi:hypothetical protein